MVARPRTRQGLALMPEATVAEGLRFILAEALKSLHSSHNQRDQKTAAAIHRFRVGIRRLRSILSAFQDAFPAERRRALDRRLREIAQHYGRAREWDVFLAETVTPMRAALADEAAVAELESCVIAARRQSLPDTASIYRDIAAIEVAIDEAAWIHQPGPGLAELWHRPLRGYAVEMLERRHRRLRKRVKRIDLSDRKAFHKLRIRVKKLRYAAEMVKSLFDEGSAEGYLARLERLQDVLGALNDAFIASDHVMELPLSPELRGIAKGWISREIAACRARYDRCARQFRKAVPFWMDDASGTRH